MEANEKKIITGGGDIIGGHIKRPENPTSAVGWVRRQNQSI